MNSPVTAHRPDAPHNSAHPAPAPNVQAVVDMVLEHADAINALEHGRIEIHCHPNEWVLSIHQRTGKSFRKRT